MRGAQNILLLTLPWLLSCGQKLELFLGEDTSIKFTLEKETQPQVTYSLRNRTISFDYQFHIDRNGSYRTLHTNDTSCSTTNAKQISSGTFVKNVSITTSLTIHLDDLSTYGNNFLFCLEDTAAYQKKVIQYSFTTALQNFLESTNESGSIDVDSGVSAEYFLFQNDWVSTLANRGTGSILATGVSNPRYHTVFIDPNDNYRLKYAVVDSGNNRVLIFNQIPTSNLTAADVVVGQDNFANGGPNADLGIGGPVSCKGFYFPNHVSVSATGILFVADTYNNRVLGFNQVPTANGTVADFVLGQVDCTSNSSGVTPTALSAPQIARPMQGKLYLVDTGNNRVLVYNSVPNSSAAADFAIGQANLTTGTATGANFTTQSDYLKTPTDVLVHDNHLYISDADYHRVLVFDAVPSVADTRPDYVLGHTSASLVLPNQGFPFATATGLNYPTNLAAQDNTLAVADRDNHRVLLYDLPITGNAQAAQKVLGQSGMTTNSPGVGQGQFNKANGLIFDGGFMWVADTENNRVQVLAIP
ncbi:MAG: hypothetical protein LDLANPLL_02503 [Turneriella sp.]|nr:hypothetical protein [Turneriella sp.]